MNAQKESLKNSSGVPQAHKKVCDENERNKQIRKNDARIKMFHGRKPFIMPIPKTSETDLHEFWVNNYGYNEGTICLVNGRISAKGMVFRVWAHEQVPLNSQWLVLRIGSTNFLHC